MMPALVLATLLAGAETKFTEVSIDQPFATYLEAQPLLMETAGAKVIRRKDGTRVVMAVGSVVLKDNAPKTRLDAEKVCRVKALAAFVSDQQGVMVAHEEKVEDRTVVVIENGKETARSVEKALQITRTKVQGLARGLAIVGRWKSKDGQVLYLALGMICDRKGDPIEAEAP